MGRVSRVKQRTNTYKKRRGLAKKKIDDVNIDVNNNVNTNTPDYVNNNSTNTPTDVPTHQPKRFLIPIPKFMQWFP